MQSDSSLITRAGSEAALFQGDLLFVPIRHHSPACAWATQQAIRAHKPDVVLIEGPLDLAHHLDLLGEPDLQLPLAIAALGPTPPSGGARAVSYYPFSEHAPEWVAIMEARAIGAEIRFIDMPIGARMAEPDQAPQIQSEMPFHTADFVRQTCKALRVRDGDELWDHLFEARLGQEDWRGLLADIYAYCLALRASTAPEIMEADQTLAREAVMRGVLSEMAGKCVVVITGGFHTPALISPGETSAPKSKPLQDSYLIAYGEEALDALSGYRAGLRYPGWYTGAWRAAQAANGPPDWQALALETTMGFAAASAAQDRRVALPQLVEMTSMAEGLARLRGREAILLHDLFDAMRAALIKGEAGPGEPFSEHMHAHLRGTALGHAPKAAGLPPIIDDARTRAGAHRVDMSSSERRAKKLDIRRKPRHRAASHFFYQMSLLDAGLGEITSGPDFLTGHRVDLLFEEWMIGWSPFVEGQLIKVAGLGQTVPSAAGHKLQQRIDEAREAGQGAALDPWLDLVLTGLRAGLGAMIPELVQGFAEAVSHSPDFEGLAQCLLRLSSVSQPGDPLYDPEAPDLGAIAVRAFERMLELLPDLHETPEEDLPSRISALRVAAGVLFGPAAARFDRPRFDMALARILESEACPPLLSGAVMGLLVNAGLKSEPELARLISGTLQSVGGEPQERIAALRGVLMTAPALLWSAGEVLKAANSAIMALPEEGFVELLPDLRREFTGLNPHETDRLAQEVVGVIGGSAGELTVQSALTQTDLARGLALDADILRILQADGVLT